MLKEVHAAHWLSRGTWHCPWHHRRRSREANSSLRVWSTFVAYAVGRSYRTAHKNERAIPEHSNAVPREVRTVSS